MVHKRRKMQRCELVGCASDNGVNPIMGWMTLGPPSRSPRPIRVLATSSIHRQIVASIPTNVTFPTKAPFRSRWPFELSIRGDHEPLALENAAVSKYDSALCLQGPRLTGHRPHMDNECRSDDFRSGIQRSGWVRNDQLLLLQHKMPCPFSELAYKRFRQP